MFFFFIPVALGHAGKRVFEFKWCMCCPGICHQPKHLSVAQIIPKTGKLRPTTILLVKLDRSSTMWTTSSVSFQFVERNERARDGRDACAPITKSKGRERLRAV